MKIGLDFDGVISDCGDLKSTGALRLFGLIIPPERCKREIVIEEGLLTAEQYSHLQDYVYGDKEFGMKMSPVPGVQLAISMLKARHDLVVITSRTGRHLEVAEEWAKVHDLRLPFIGVTYGESKATAAAGCDVFVDDDLEKLEALVDVVPRRFLFSWGYNRHQDVGEIAVRVSNWKQLYLAI